MISFFSLALSASVYAFALSWSFKGSFFSLSSSPVDPFREASWLFPLVSSYF